MTRCGTIGWVVAVAGVLVAGCAQVPPGVPVSVSAYEQMPPGDGFPIEEPGTEPKRYKGLLDTLPLGHQQLFWSNIWDLANDPETLQEHDIKTEDGKRCYLIEQPAFAFKALVDYMQLKSFIEDGKSIPLPPFEDAEEKHYFQKIARFCGTKILILRV